jgi:uncharacterized protein YjhX (UPF0386 family)
MTVRASPEASGTGRASSCLQVGTLSLNISKPQQRTLHALAQGASIQLIRDEKGGLIAAECWTREGWLLSDCNLGVFKALKRRKLIASQGGRPYRITREGLLSLRSQLDNRVTSKSW